jgi:hypothetical protein
VLQLAYFLLLSAKHVSDTICVVIAEYLTGLLGLSNLAFNL